MFSVFIKDVEGRLDDAKKLVSSAKLKSEAVMIDTSPVGQDHINLFLNQQHEVYISKVVTLRGAIHGQRRRYRHTHLQSVTYSLQD